MGGVGVMVAPTLLRCEAQPDTSHALFISITACGIHVEYICAVVFYKTGTQI